MDKETKDEFAEVKGLITRLDEAIRGNGKEGLITRIVKIEQISKMLCWVAAIITVPVVGMAIKTIYEHLKQ